MTVQLIRTFWLWYHFGRLIGSFGGHDEDIEDILVPPADWLRMVAAKVTPLWYHS